MNKRPFMAVNWLGNPTAQKTNRLQDDTSDAQSHAQLHNSNGAVQLNTQTNNSLENKVAFDLGNYIVPQWKGEGLLSKSGLKLKSIIKKLYVDANNLIITFPERNKSLKQTVYNEFITYVESEEINTSEISDYVDFWNHYLDDSSAYQQVIHNFLDLYKLRAVNIYLLKVRFLSLLMRTNSKALSTIELLNPDSTIRKVFTNASSTELSCDALRLNEFSWFRPSQELGGIVDQLSNILTDLDASQFMKVCNYEVPLDLNLKFKDERNEVFSHALSNRNFGLFINDLIIHIPEWIESHNGYFNFDSEPKCLNTLFTGDYLNSLSLSHWLAQESNLHFKWDEVICPDFKGSNFQTGSYLKVSQEIQFLTFLVNMAERQNHNPVSLICSLFKQKNAKSKVNVSGQMSIFAAEQTQECIYDRLVVNLIKSPKTNPHHHLLTQIQIHGEKISNNGYLYIFTNQKLFVPSHSEKIEGLLKRYKLHARINFENLQGKGEIAKYLYIFNKRILSNKMDLFNSSAPKLQKESCLSLNFSGQLLHFSKFELLRNEFHSFITNKETINSTLYQKEFDLGLSFEFHQDAILNGKLLSNNGDSNNITHPSYFKNLTRTCIPFDQFFMIENLTAQGKNYTSDLLGLSINAEERFTYLLIVDFTAEQEIRVELTTADLFKAKVEEYGNAYFQYFGLIPKTGNLNVNLFREFFLTNVGKQIIQLTFNGGLKKTKSRLKAMLVPKFIMETDFIPKHQADLFKILSINTEEFKFRHPQQIMTELKTACETVKLLQSTYPWHLSCLVSHFKYTVEEALTDLNSNPDGIKVDYSNPVIMEDLLSLKKSNIYPHNDDIYVETKLKDRNDIHLPLTHCDVIKTETGHALELHSEGKHLISLCGELELLHFINFILSNSNGAQISKILQCLEVPKASDIKDVLGRHDEIEKSLSEYSEIAHNLLESIIIGQIFN